MTLNELAGKIDQSFLRPDVSRKAVMTFLEKAAMYPFASVCVPPCYVTLAAGVFKGNSTKVSTVIGFPLGYQTTAVKVTESHEACAHGASEIDVMMNLSLFKSGGLSSVRDEIREVAAAAGIADAVVKVIIESGCLSDEEKKNAVKVAIEAGAHYVKTSTGFGPTGATVPDIRLLRQAAEGHIKIKAAGGIKTLQETLEFIDAGADRIGTSMGVEILQALEKRGF